MTEDLRLRRPARMPGPAWDRLRADLAALALHVGDVRIGADSRPETFLRLALIDSGLPEPALQYPILDDDGRVLTVVDLAYPEARLAIHYDGAPHLSPEALDKDIGRDNLLIAARWRSIRASRADYRAGFQSTVSLVRAVLSDRRWL